MSWKNVDLNLLIIFDALMSERNVTRAGQKVGLSQPAVSASLAKLRQSFNDELFIREAGGIRPTPKALELSGKFKKILGDIESALSETQFDPQTKAMTVCVEMDAYAQTCFLPQLYSYLKSEAPNISLRVKSEDSQKSDYEKFQTDLYFTTDGFDLSKNNSVEIFSDDYVLCTKKDFKGGKISLEDLCSLPHIEIQNLTPHRSHFDRYLEPLALFRPIQFKIPFPITAMMMLQEGDLMCVLPRRFVKIWTKKLGVNVYELPVEIPPVKLRMVCMPAFSDCDFYEWIIKNIKGVLRGSDQLQFRN